MTHTLGDLCGAMPGFMTHRAPATVRKQRGSLSILIKAIGDMRLYEIGRPELSRFRCQRIEQVRPATVNSNLRHIKSGFSYAVDNGWLDDNPALRWRGYLIREPEQEIRVVEQSEFSMLLHATDPEFGAYLSLCYYEGLRRGEACVIRWPAINFRGNIVKVLNLPTFGEFTKSRRNRTVPLRAPAKSMLWRLHQSRSALHHDLKGHMFKNRFGRPWNPDQTGERFGRLVRHVGIASCTLHDLRRSFSTLLQRAGIDVGTVQLLGGWSSIEVVRRHYTGDLHGHLASAMSQMDQVYEELDYAT